MDFSLRPRAASMSQRMARVWRRVGANLDRHLVGGAADATGLHLDHRLHVVERLVEDFERLSACRPVFSAMRSMAPYTMRSATDFLPRS